MSANIHTYIHTYIQLYVCTYIDTYIQTYIIRTCIHTYIYTCMHAYIHTYIHAYIYIHTYMHVHISKYFEADLISILRERLSFNYQRNLSFFNFHRRGKMLRIMFFMIVFSNIALPFRNTIQKWIYLLC